MSWPSFNPVKMATPRCLFLLLGALLLVERAYSVDHTTFKTCDQSSFCRRLRALPADNSPYELLLNTISLEAKHTLQVEMVNKEYQVSFILKLTALADSTFRMIVDEKLPLKPRYRVEYALNGPPKTDTLTILETDTAKGFVRVSNTLGNAVILRSAPFRAEFFDVKGDVVAIINEKGLTTLEHIRERKTQQHNQDEGDNAVENANNGPEEKDPGAWEENFKSHHDSKLLGPEGLSMDVTFPKATHLYGIPEHADSFALRTTIGQEPYRLFNLDVFEYELQSTMALYGSVPVIYAHGVDHTVGVLFLNAAETWVDVENSRDSNMVSSIVSFVSGTQAEEQVSARFISEAGIMEVYVMLGPSPSDCFKQYTTLTGTAPLPQLFSLAYHQSRWNYNDEEDVAGVDAGFDLHDIPMDVIWLDIEYTDGKKYFTWDPMKFSTPSDMVANLTAKGRRMVVIIDPHIKREVGYFVHDEATDNNYYVKDKDGKDYEGWCWPGSSSYLDFYNPTVRQYYSSKYAFNLFEGTSDKVHIWNDMNEPSVFNGPEVTMPKDCLHFGGWEHRHVHNTYGLMHTMATHAGLLERSGGKDRPFVLTRSHYAGTQRYAAVWTGDNMAEWGHLKATIPMCLSLGVAGISQCGADVGGFFKYPESELMTRWYQAAAFQPFFRAHSHIDTKRREPWLYDADTTGLIRDAIRRRYAYLPVWYTQFYEHSIDGLPVMRPTFMLFPQQKDLFSLDTQFTIGDSLLVCPVTDEGATSVNVVLPGDSNQVWYDVDSYLPFKAGKFNQPVTISKIPVYQRGGAIVAKKERMRRASSLMAEDPYTFVVALNSNASAEGSLYIDDGSTFEYTKGSYIYAKIEFQNNELSYTFPDPTASYPTESWLERVVIAGIIAPPKGANLIVETNSNAPKTSALALTYHTGNNVLVIRKPEAPMNVPWKIVLSV